MKKLIYSTLMFAMFFASGTVFNSKNSLKAHQSENQVLSEFNLLFPPTGLTLETEPGNNTPIDITWTASGPNATYKWKFGAPMISTVILDLPSNNNGTATALTVTPAAVDAILAGLGLNPGDAVSGEWAVWAYEAGDSLKSVETFNITFKRKVIINQFNLLFPPTGLIFETEPGNNTPIDITWTASGPNATYKWKFGAPMINSVILDLNSNNNGTATALTVTPAAVDGILADLGVNPGGSVSGEWAVWAYDGNDSLKSVETYNITFKRKN